MSVSRQTVRDLLTAYDRSLEQQIVSGGSSLVCRDEELWNQVEELLRDGDAQETHCLGLDPLTVMEESLKAAAAASAGSGGGKVRARGGLRSLDKAFEVLEQAALNLYLTPWREEYKVVKMYSGPFTHYIKPVLSVPQIEKLFGLLGYHSSSPQHQQLCLQLLRISPSSVDDLLRLSCAFYLARCECRLLQAALGKHAGEAQWELRLVRERQRGHGVQVAVDNAMKTLKVDRPLMQPFDGEADVDLYTDDHVNGGQMEAAPGDNKTWLTQMSASPPAGKTRGEEMASSSTPPPASVCVSTFNCQLSAAAAAAPAEPALGSSDVKKQSRRSCDKPDAEPQPGRLSSETAGLCAHDADVDRLCSCLQSPHVYLQRCMDCKSLHSITCALLHLCEMEKHCVLSRYATADDVKEVGAAVAASLQSESLGVSDARGAACDDPASTTPPLRAITYHDCCDLALLDPQLLCRSCGVFHCSSCRDVDVCQRHHSVRQLGVCACGKPCARKPLVLCRYCGNEFCRACWYRSPVFCTCGQTFDQSSSV
ncbi:spermatogenesis associated 2-like [Solea solea]|uniref:spermatogenesis associated 2-like n=1 Tax=Solea solea TaxID=90069 RepID=UPI00272D923B|nr:spermatogenesis associated 2-like [Solea solea]XP_058501105.1 spermatogenesis associated 2-like [Solea solea]